MRPEWFTARLAQLGAAGDIPRADGWVAERIKVRRLAFRGKATKPNGLENRA
jgi:hypothetical protein